MKILITGSGGGGTWSMRAEQLGRAAGATILPHATVTAMRAHDVVVAIKRIDQELVHRLQDSGTPWLWDVVDAYPQNAPMTREEAIAWFDARLGQLRPNAVIWPSRAMAYDLAEFARGWYVPHHPYEHFTPQPLYPTIKVMGYLGMARYIDAYRPMLAQVCSEFGVEFCEGVGQVKRSDVMISFRAPPWNGYQMTWKPAIKLANAQKLGIPLIGEASAFERDADLFGAVVEPCVESIGTALQKLSSREIRMAIRKEALSCVPTLATAARTLQTACREFLYEHA